MSENSDDWLTTAAAAEITGYHVNYVRQLLAAGEVEAQKFGPVWMVSRTSLEAYMVRQGDRGAKRGRKPHKPIA